MSKATIDDHAHWLDLCAGNEPSAQDAERLHNIAVLLRALSAGQAQPVGYRWTFDASEPRKWYYADALPEEWRFGNPEKTEPVYAAPVPPPAVPGEVHAQLALIKHLAEYTTEKNWADKRLYIMQAVDRALSAPSASIEGETP